MSGLEDYTGREHYALAPPGTPQPCLRGVTEVERTDGCGTAGHSFSAVATVNVVVGQYRVSKCLARRTGCLP